MINPKRGSRVGSVEFSCRQGFVHGYANMIIFKGGKTQHANSHSWNRVFV